MTRTELYKMAEETSRKVVEENMESIMKHIHSVTHNEDGSKLPLKDFPSAVAALSITVAPDISAAVTARMLVDLGLVTLDND